MNIPSPMAGGAAVQFGFAVWLQGTELLLVQFRGIWVVKFLPKPVITTSNLSKRLQHCKQRQIACVLTVPVADLEADGGLNTGNVRLTLGLCPVNKRLGLVKPIAVVPNRES